MTLENWLKENKFTLIGDKEIWVFERIEKFYDRPIVLKRLSDGVLAFVLPHEINVL